MANILNTVLKYKLFDKQETVVAAISGGVDSMVLLHMLHKDLKAYNLNIVVAHVNHKKRDASDLDEKLVKEVTTQYGLSYECYTLPEDKSGGNFHAYAHKERYNFFKRVAAKYGATSITTAHHIEDHLETFIYRALYRTSPRGLIGIEAKTYKEGYKVVRPLIEMTKEELYTYSNDNNVLFREDESNKSDDYTRNRIRHNIIPPLVAENKGVYAHVSMISQQLSDDEAYFMERVTVLMENVKYKNGSYIVSRSQLNNLPKSISRRLLKHILNSFICEGINNKHIEQLLALSLNEKANLQHKLPGDLVCNIAYDTFELTKERVFEGDYNYLLELDSEVVLTTGMTVLSSMVEGLKLEGFSFESKDVILLNSEDVVLPLSIRTRKPGERIEVTETNSKRLKKLMLEEKVPKLLRDAWPLVVDAEDKVIWVPGLKRSKYCLSSVVDIAGDLMMITFKDGN